MWPQTWSIRTDCPRLSWSIYLDSTSQEKLCKMKLSFQMMVDVQNGAHNVESLNSTYPQRKRRSSIYFAHNPAYFVEDGKTSPLTKTCLMIIVVHGSFLMVFRNLIHPVTPGGAQQTSIHLPTPCHTGRRTTPKHSTTNTLSHRAARNTEAFIHQHPVTPGGAQSTSIHLPTPCHTGRRVTQKEFIHPHPVTPGGALHKRTSSSDTLSHRAARNTKGLHPVTPCHTGRRVTQKEFIHPHPVTPGGA